MRTAISCSLGTAALALAMACAGATAFSRQPSPPTMPPASTSTPASAPADAGAPAPGAVSAPGRHVTFELHAQFYSQYVDRKPVTDPQIYVKDPNADSGTGPQDIEHVKGIRPALLTDPPDSHTYNADGELLLCTLGAWSAATGDATIVSNGATDTISTNFANLIPFGVYSLFKIAFTANGTPSTPLDGTGQTDGFVAGSDGSAHFTVTTPAHVAPGDAIVLVYHSDGLDHGTTRGELGLTAHEVLIARLPR